MIEFWAWMTIKETVDEKDRYTLATYLENESGTWMPMIAADLEIIMSLRPMAEQLSKECGNAIKLVKFGNCEIVEVIEK